MPSGSIYIGIDPGASGGLAAIADGKLLTHNADKGLEAAWDWVLQFAGTNARAVIEQQTARPSRYIDKITKAQVSTILASTVDLYGSYRELRALLTCACIEIYEDCPPKRWHAWLGMRKPGGASQSSWKGMLKQRALAMFPEAKITLATADAVLLAKYCEVMFNATNPNRPA